MITFLPDLNGRYPEDKELFFQELPEDAPLYDYLSYYDENKGDQMYNLWLANTIMGYALSDAYFLFEKTGLPDRSNFGCNKLEAEKVSAENNELRMQNKCNAIVDQVVEGVSPGVTNSMRNPARLFCDNLLKVATNTMVIAVDAHLACVTARRLKQKILDGLRYIAWAAYHAAKIA